MKSMRAATNVKRERGAIASDVTSLLPLSAAVFHIMLSLAERERHGYSIAKEVERSTDGTVQLQPTALYRHLKQMRADGWVEESKAIDPDDARRRAYRLTPRGRHIAQAEARRLAGVVRLARTRALLPAGFVV